MEEQHSVHSDGTATSLLSLPVELVNNCFKELDIEDKYALFTTCRTLRKLYANDPDMRLRALLGETGYVLTGTKRWYNDLDLDPEHISIFRSEDEWCRVEESPEARVSYPKIPSPSLAPWVDSDGTTKDPHPSVPNVSDEPPAPVVLAEGWDESPTDIFNILKGRERRWEYISPAATRVVHAQVPLGTVLVNDAAFLLAKPLENFFWMVMPPLPVAADPDLKQRPDPEDYTPFGSVFSGSNEFMDFDAWTYNLSPLYDPEHDLVVYTIWVLDEEDDEADTDQDTEVDKEQGAGADDEEDSNEDVQPFSNQEAAEVEVDFDNEENVGGGTEVDSNPDTNEDGDVRRLKSFRFALTSRGAWLAAKRILDLPPPPPLTQIKALGLGNVFPEMEGQACQILGSTLAVLVRWRDSENKELYVPHLVLWDWTKGKLLGIWSFLPNSDAEETHQETPHYATCVAQLNLPPVGRFARINSLDVPGNTQAVPRDPDTAYLLSDGDTLERVVPIKQSAYRGVCIFRICASWDRPVLPKEGKEGVWAAGSGEQVYGLYVLRETLVQLAREGEARLRDTVTMDTSPRPAATDMGNPDKPCPVPLCACDGGVGGPRVRLSPGQSYTATTTDQDEHGRTFTGLSGNSVYHRYEWAAWGEKGAHVLSESYSNFDTCGYRATGVISPAPQPEVSSKSNDTSNTNGGGSGNSEQKHAHETIEHTILVFDFNPSVVAREESRQREAGHEPVDVDDNVKDEDYDRDLDDDNNAGFRQVTDIEIETTFDELELAPGLVSGVSLANEFAPNPIFPQGIKGALPYRWVKRQVNVSSEEEVLGTMIDEEHLIMVLDRGPVPETDDQIVMCF